MIKHIKADDAQVVAAIASEFMTDQRYSAWYDKNCDEYEGTSGIWLALGNVATQIIEVTYHLKIVGFEWHNFEFMEAVFAIVDVLYERGFEQNWLIVLLEILGKQNGLAFTEELKNV